MIKENLNFKSKRRSIQIDLFGTSVNLRVEDGSEYFFYLEEKNKEWFCYVKSKKIRKKEWSKSELLRKVFDKGARFKFSDSNEFGFILN